MQQRVEMRVKGRIDERWSEWFSGFTITHVAEGDETILTGLVPDQAALYGLLAKLRDVGLALLSVDSEEVEEDEAGEEDAPEQQGSPCTGTDPGPTANEVSNLPH